MDRREMLGALGAVGLTAAAGVSYGQAQSGRQGAGGAGGEERHDGHEAGAPHTLPDMVKQMRSMNEMMVKHLGGHDKEFELRFIDLMIPHHEGAIAMARHALEHASRPEIKQMAEKAIEQQQKEIDQMKKWRKDWYGK